MRRLDAWKSLLVAGAVVAALGVGVLLATRLDPPDDGSPRRRDGAVDEASPGVRLLPGRAPAPAPPPPATTSEATAGIRLTVTEGYGEKRIAGAVVRIGTRAGTERAVTTGADGLAIFEAVPAGEVHVSVGAPGYAIARDYWFKLEPGEVREIAEHLDVAGTLRGRVLDAADGRPVEGAVARALQGGPVNISPSGPPRVEREFGTATTDSRGAFAVDGVARGDALWFSLRIVRVEAPGHRTQWRVVSARDGEDGVVVRLQPGGTLKGVVRRADGAPAAGATVLATLDDDGRSDPLWSEEVLQLPTHYDSRSFGTGSYVQDPTQDAWAVLEATADEAGRFAMPGLGLGERYAVRARAHGFGTSEIARGVAVTREEPVDRAEFRLRGAHRVTVRVLDSEGSARPGFSVRLDAAETPSQVDTDAAGLARFEGLPPGQYSLQVWGAGAYHSAPDAVVKDADVEVVVRLERPTAAVEPPGGVAHDAQGASPAAFAPSTPRAPTLIGRIAVAEGSTPPLRVSVRGAAGGGSTAWGGMEWEPDAAGTVPLVWTLDWPSYVLSIEADAFLPIVREVRGAPVDLGTLVLSPGRTLVGLVVAPDGATPADVEVKAVFRADGITPGAWHGGDEPPTFERVAKTDAAGRFRIAGLPDGKVALSVDDSRYLAYDAVVDVPPPETPLRIAVHPGGIARVRVETAGGYPAPRRQITIDPAKSERDFGSCACGETDLAGGFSARLAPGTYRVRLTGGSADEEDALPASSRAVVTLADGETQDVRLVAPPR